MQQKHIYGSYRIVRIVYRIVAHTIAETIIKPCVTDIVHCKFFQRISI